MNIKFPSLLALPLMLVFGVSVIAQQSSQFERDRGKTMLNIIKNDLKKNYYDPTFRGWDLETHFKEAEDRIKAAETQNQIFGIIAHTLAQLDDSHTYFVPPSRPYTLEYGWNFQMIGEKCFVVAVKPGSDAEAKGLKEGDEVNSIDGIRPGRQNLWQIQYLYRALSPRSGMRIIVTKPDGQQQQIDVMAKVKQGKRIMDLTSGSDIFDLIRQGENEDRFNRHRYYELGDELMIWKMPAFNLEPDKVDDMMSKAKKRKALILDLRGNGGGAETTLLRLIGNFFDHEIKLGDIKRRKETKPIVAKTRGGEIFTGKLFVLIDSESGSAAELFARIVQLEKRGTVLGDVSSGAVMRSKPYSYQHGLDVVVFYGASITDADIVMTDGKSLERIGVTPDEFKLPTAQEMAAKLDPVLAYAASLAGVMITPEKAGTMFPIEWRK
jgi:C-terminal processing protease CtpA/Prc